MSKQSNLCDIVEIIGRRYNTILWTFGEGKDQEIKGAHPAPDKKDLPIGAKKIILIVEDRINLLETLKDLFEERGYTVITAKTGNEAVTKAAKTCPDIALIDIILPGINGIETLKKIKTFNPNILAIMMTGYAVEELVKEAQQADVAAILYKPFKPQKMFSLIEGGGSWH